MNPDPPQNFNPQKLTLIILIFAMATGVILYRLLVSHNLGQTAALFIGLPTLLAIVVVSMPRAKSVTGILLKGITIFLLISGIFLGEGFLCILLAAPLFYLVGIVIGLSVDYIERRRKNRVDKNTLCLIFFPFLFFSLEGVDEPLSFPRMESATSERTIKASLMDVESSLSQVPHFDRELPPFLSIGFPRPIQTKGQGLCVGDRRTISFSGSEGQFLGEGKPGDLTLEVEERGTGWVRFKVVGDTTHFPHWLQWEGCDVRWASVDARHTRVMWTAHYRRLLDPAWYFGPLEQYAMQLASGYLIDNVATPAP